jgi:S-formylglutathione hydrolase
MQHKSKHACFGGELLIVEHDSTALNCAMTFSLFLPPQAKEGRVPLVTFLSGLTCTHENFTTKAGAYGVAAQLGIAILAPDTSPRGDNVADDADSYDFGKGAGFYVNATQEPWAAHYRMEDYVAKELYALIPAEFPVLADAQSICGHSMGGHGALTLYFNYPGQWKSASAFAPIVAPSQVPWGQKAFAGYLGDDREAWARYDASLLVLEAGKPSNAPILIDQGGADNFLEQQLKPEVFVDSCAQSGQHVELRLQPHYDHSYYFIQSFIGDHLRHHAQYLR